MVSAYGNARRTTSATAPYGNAHPTINAAAPVLGRFTATDFGFSEHGRPRRCHDFCDSFDIADARALRCETQNCG
jgi:hypothetical protein